MKPLAQYILEERKKLSYGLFIIALFFFFFGGNARAREWNEGWVLIGGGGYLFFLSLLGLFKKYFYFNARPELEEFPKWENFKTRAISLFIFSFGLFNIVLGILYLLVDKWPSLYDFFAKITAPFL